MITKCIYKVDKWKKTNRIPNVKCKKTPNFVIKCVGENNCDYIKNQNRIMKEQEKGD